ncbi:MAG: cryptochrome/photolyase family protein [Polaromonas sp.]|nr:cryptochrome/photolyase family protein [Polaromonas sp.]
MATPGCRHLHLILGDQLDEASSVFDGFDAAQDLVLMIEALEESTHVWSHKARTALFLSAMRHFAADLRQRGLGVCYRALGTEDDATLADGLLAAVTAFQPVAIIGVEPGDMRVRHALETAVAGLPTSDKPALAIEWREDRHFLCSLPRFQRWAARTPSLRMELFYRKMRQAFQVLMDGDKPAGGQWNFDTDNRKGFGRKGPVDLPTPPRFVPDDITRDVLDLVEARFTGHPGDLSAFNWPVTRAEALAALDDFIAHRLPFFGVHQDAMWTHMPFGWHALLSSAMNLKLLNPLEVVRAAETAWRERGLDLASVEGFIRQVLGWREFMRGIYFLEMPQLKQANHFGHSRALPAWYWTGDTHMNCMRQCIGQTLRLGYAHHIQRLMVTGMFGVTAGLSPQAVCDWYLAVYIDAVEWVELPNTAGMALFADGGRFTSKPYIAGGAYIRRMSNYCNDCRYEPQVRTGASACPMTVLYWNFVDGHAAELEANPRTAVMVQNLQRLGEGDRLAIRERAATLLADLDAL